MSSNIDIILRVRDDGSVTLQKAATNMKALGEAAQTADAKLKQAATGTHALASAAQKVDGAGRQARIGLSSAAQAAGLLGVNIGNVVGPAAAAADAIGDLAGSGAALGPTGIAVGALVVAFGILNSAMEAQNAKLADLYLRTDAWAQSLQRAGVVTGEVAVKLNELAAAQARVQTGWSFQGGDIAQSLELNNPAILSTIAGLHALGIEIKDLTPGLETSAEQAARLKEEIDNLTFGARSGYDALEQLRASSEYAASAAYQHAAAERTRKAEMDAATAAALAEALQIGNLNAAFAAMRFGEDYPDAFMRAAHAGKAMNDVNQRGIPITNDLNAAQKRLADEGLRAVEAAAKRVRDTIRSMVESALQPTSVTMEDMNASLTGKYIPKWDEFRRRVEAIATGSSIEQFGPKFKAQLEMVQAMFKDLNLDQIAAKFKDFSLFADMDLGSIKQLIDFGPIEAQVSAQVDSIIGKAKAMKVAFDDVWASLSTQKKIDLADALGLDAGAGNIEGLKSQIQGAVTGATTGVADAATAGLTSGLNTAAAKAGDLSKTIATNLNPGMTDLKKNVETLLPSLQGAGDTLTKATNPAFAALDTSSKNILASLQGLKPALDDALKSFDTWVNGMPGYQSAITNLIANALEPLRNTLSGIVSELEAIIKKANEAAAALAGMNGSSSGTGGGTTTPTNTTPGFASGGTFRVTGRPGIDTNLVSFRATRGEVVSITPPGQARGRAGQTFAFDFRGANFTGADPRVVDALIAGLSQLFDNKMERLAMSAYNFDAFNGN